MVKYDIRGIQKFIFRTKKLREIRSVQNTPETIIFKAFKNAANTVLKLDLKENMSEPDCLEIFSANGIEILDKAGGNAYVFFDCENAKYIYEKISREMAFYILKETYSLELVYACVECTENFYEDYEKLNAKLGKLKSKMPSAYHIGAFPICRSDKDTYLPIIAKDKYNNDVTMESYLKGNFNASLSNSHDENVIDNYILEKGTDSHIAIIHIDGNNMGARINEILKNTDYSKAKDTFKSIKVRDRFAEVCKEMDRLTDEYKKVLSKNSQKDPKDIHLVHAIIQAGDDITYITRADIALSFTKKFIKLISEKYMADDTDDIKYTGNAKYLISACVGIAYIDSHFPFADGYDLAEACCSNAKSRAKKNKSPDGYIGNWIDFEICHHIKSANLSQNRKLYGNVDDTVLYKKPYCIKHPNYQNEFFDFDSFENKIQNLLSDNPVLNRSRAKKLRETYSAGSEYVETLKKSAESRNYLSSENGEKINFYDEYKSNKGETIKYASYYDAIDIMDLYSDFNTKEES